MHSDNFFIHFVREFERIRIMYLYIKLVYYIICGLIIYLMSICGKDILDITRSVYILSFRAEKFTKKNRTASI